MAAKSLLHDVPQGTFDVTIFDAQTRIGGLWPLDKDDNGGMVHPQMVANQSKHTVQFSDLAWEEDDPEFPRAWQVGRYLQRYLERYCQGATLRLGTRVDKVEILPSSIKDGEGPKWKVSVSHNGKQERHAFDYLLVASGYFGAMTMFPEAAEEPEVPVIHSSRYRDLASLLASRPHSKGGKILVVGGQMSGVEIAGTIATHLSSAVHSPGTSPIPYPETYSVHHLTQKPVWVFPLYTTPKVSYPPDLRPIMFMPANRYYSPTYPRLPSSRWICPRTTWPTGPNPWSTPRATFPKRRPSPSTPSLRTS